MACAEVEGGLKGRESSRFYPAPWVRNLGTSYFSTTSRLHLGEGRGYELAAELRQNQLLGWEVAVVFSYRVGSLP